VQWKDCERQSSWFKVNENFITLPVAKMNAIWVRIIGGKILTRENTSAQRKSCRSVKSSTTNPIWTGWGQTRASVEKNWRITAYHRAGLWVIWNTLTISTLYFIKGGSSKIKSKIVHTYCFSLVTILWKYFQLTLTVNNFLINDCARITDISVIYKFPSVILVIADLWIHSQEA
jgi:hypothetical protein